MYVAFMELCENRNFDIETARKVLSQMNPSKEFQISPKVKDKEYFSMWFTPLSMAVFYTNLPMVELLLEYGADPNVVYNEYENVLWDLQYNDGITDEENEIRLVIARKLLENGANPKVVVEGEDLFHWVLACSHDDIRELADYRMKFLDLLEEYIDWSEEFPD